MTATRDKFGRPIVAVTGMGVITSLGAGLAENWSKLTAGQSGLSTITRFPTDGLKTTVAGTVDFVAVDPFTSTDLASGSPISPPRKRSANPASAPRVTSPARYSWRSRRSKPNGPRANSSPRQSAAMRDRL